MKMYLIDGVSGSGKTTICEELTKRGYKTIEADEVLGGFIDPKTGLSTEDHASENWHWDIKKFNKMVKEIGEGDVFVCGGAMNKSDFLHHFNKIFTLQIDDETLKQRLQNRTNNEYGKKPEELAFQLKENKETIKYSKERGAILINATKPINAVVDQIIKNLK